MKEKTMNKKIKNKKQGLDKVLFYILVFLTPVFFLPATLSPVALNKQLLAGVLLIALLIYTLARFLTSGKIILPPKYLGIMALAVFGAALLSAIFSQAKSVSFLGTSPDSVFWIGVYVVAFFAGIASLKTVKGLKGASLAYLSGIGLVSIFSILQLTGVFVLPFSFTKDVGFNPVGSVFAFGFLLASALVAILAFLNIAPTSKKMRTGLGVAAAFFGLIILQINLWSIWLSIAIAAILAALVAGSRMTAKKEANLRPMFIPFGLIMVSLFFIIIGAQVPSFIANTAEVGLPPQTTWDITQDAMTPARWVSGTGPGTFAYNYSLHRPLDINQTNFWGVQFSQGYSALSTYLSTLGVLGVGAILAFLGMFFITSLRGAFYVNKLTVKRDRDDAFLNGIAIAAISAAAVLAAGMFIYKGNPLLHLFLFLYAGVALSALIKLGAAGGIKFDVTKKPQAMITSSMVALVLITVAFGGMYILGQRYLAQVYLAQGVSQYQQDQDLDRTLNKLQGALDMNSSDEATLRAVSQALVLRLGEIVNNKDLSQQEAATQFNNTLQSAVSAARQATSVNPKETQNWIQLGTVYENLVGFVDGAARLAEEAYEEARKLDPNNPSLPLAIARVYIANADVLQTQLSTLAQNPQASAQSEQELIDARVASLNTSVEYLGQSLELKPDYTSASFLLASAYQRLGQLDKAIIETRQLALQAPSDPNMAFQLGLLYYQNKEFEKARAELERSITLAEGQFANARYYLGLTYEELNRREDAIEQFEQLSEDNPGNELVEKILDNLRNGRDVFANITPQDSAPPIEDTGGAQEPAFPVEN